jgi:hypothetical protein
MAPVNGETHDAVEDIPTRKLHELTYEIVRARANAETELYDAIGRLAREVSFNTQALDRFTPALIQAVTAVQPNVPAPNTPRSRLVTSMFPGTSPMPTSPGPPMTSLVEPSESDNTAITELKEKLRPILQREADAATIAKTDARRMAAAYTAAKVLATLLGIAVAALTIWALTHGK